MAEDDAVRVAIRVRPFVGIERAQECQSVVNYPAANQIQLAQAHTFTYDYLYTENETQTELYDTCVAPLTKQFLCLESHTLVALAAGACLQACDVKAGEQLIGDHGQPVEVKSVRPIPNVMRMVRVATRAGEYTVTPEHRLTMRWNQAPTVTFHADPSQPTRLLMEASWTDPETLESRVWGWIVDSESAAAAWSSVSASAASSTALASRAYETISGSEDQLHSIATAFMADRATLAVGDLFEVEARDLLAKWSEWSMDEEANQRASGCLVPVTQTIDLPTDDRSQLAHAPQQALDALEAAAVEVEQAALDCSLHYYTLLSTGEGHYRHLQPADEVDVVYQLLAPIETTAARPSLRIDGKRAYTFLPLDRAHRDLGVDETNARIVLTEVGLGGDATNACHPAIAQAYSDACRASCSAALAIGASRVVAFGRTARDQWTQQAAALADTNTKPVFATIDGVPTLHLTHADIARTIYFAPHPAALDVSDRAQMLAALTAAHGCTHVDPSLVHDHTHRIDRVTRCESLTQSSTFDVTNIEVIPRLDLHGKEVVGSRRFALANGTLTHNSGYNATILAYGQTGSGKTHTMGTSSSVGMKREEYGIIPRVIFELFDLMRAKEHTHTFMLTVSFLEIYNDDIIDLLCTIPRGRADRPIPQIKEGRGDHIEVAHVVNADVKSAEETLETLERGSLNRATGSTAMNASSSRSHAIFTLTLSQKVREDEMGVSNDEFITSKFHFVDLAGSERLKRTGAVGERMREGININQGLLALGNVISALGDPTRKGGHVPFRDSKITRLLKDSLGGNSKTLMIAAVSPADVNREETLNTLQYANRAKNIRNQPVINRDPTSMKLDMLRGRIKELEAELAVYQAGGVPTADQRAEWAALAQSVASGGMRVAPASFASAGGVMASGVPHSSSSHMVDFGSVGLDEMVVKSSEWASTKEQLLQYEVEFRKLQARNAKLRQDVSVKADETLKAAGTRDAMRHKIEQLAERFPDVKQYLIDERAQVDKEREAKRAANDGGAGVDTPDALSSPDAAADGDADVNLSATVGADVDVSDDDDAFFSIHASGGADTPFNRDLSVLAEKNSMIVKLLRKYKRQKAKLAEDQELFERVKMRLAALKKQNRALKRANELGEPYDIAEEEEADADAAAGATAPGSLDHSREEEDDDDDDGAESEDGASSRRKNSLSLKEGAVDDLSSPVSGVLSPSASDPSSLLSPSDIEDLDYDSADEKDEEDLASLHTLAQLKEREHAHQNRLLLDEHSTLEDEISSKEVFLAQLTEQNKRSRFQHDMYLQQVAELEREKVEKERRIAELEKLMQSKPTTPANAHGGLSQAESKELLRSKAELKKVSDELRAYREKLRAAQDAQKRQHAADESRIRQLTGEIEKAKKARVDVSRKLDESSVKYKDWVAGYENKLKLLQKDQRKDALRLRTLNEELAQKNIQLKRMNEKNTLLSRKVRDQDSATQVARAAKSAAAKAKSRPASKANMPYLGNYNSNASDSHRLKEIKTARGKEGPGHRRKLTRDGKDGSLLIGGVAGVGGHSRSKSQSSALVLDTGLLATPAGAESLAREFASFVGSETSRVALAKEVEFFRTQIEHYKRALADSSEALMNVPDDATPDLQNALESEHSANELAFEASKASLADVERRLGDLTAAGGPLEERVAARFKSALVEPPKRVVAILLRAMIDMQIASGTGAPPAFHFDQAELPPSHSPTSSGSSSGLEVASPSHFRRRSALVQGTASLSNSGANAAALGLAVNTSSLSSSPLFKPATRSSLPTAVASPPRNTFGQTRKSASGFASSPTSSLHSSTGSNGGLGSLAGVTLTGHHVGMAFSPMQPHLIQTSGIAPATQPTYNDAGDEELLHLKLPAAAFQGQDERDSSAPVAGGSMFDDEDGTFLIAGPLSPTKGLSSSSGRALHNNYVGIDGGEESTEDDVIAAADDKKKDRHSGGVRSRVFDRLTDPLNFTGTSKQTAQTARSARGSLNAGSGTPTGQSLPPQSKKVPTALTSLLTLPTSGRVSASSDRSPSPSGGVSEDSPASSARVPFHERLNDPKSYTGAQRAKFQEGVKRAAVGTSTGVSREQEREAGFVLGHGRPAQLQAQAQVQSSATPAVAVHSASPPIPLARFSLESASQSVTASDSSVIGDGSLFDVVAKQHARHRSIALDEEVADNKENANDDDNVCEPTFHDNEPKVHHTRSRSRATEELEDVESDEE